MNMYIPIVLGTGREGRWSEKVARFVLNRLEGREDVETEIIDVRDHLIHPFTIPAWVDDERPKKWREIATKADGFVFVVPEYNHSFPGELKLLLDGAYKEYKGKPAGLVSVSNGNYGGVRAIEHLIPLISNFGMTPIPSTVATAKVEELFADDQPTDERYIEFTDTMLDQLVNSSTKQKKGA